MIQLEYSYSIELSEIKFTPASLKISRIEMYSSYWSLYAVLLITSELSSERTIVALE